MVGIGFLRVVTSVPLHEGLSMGRPRVSTRVTMSHKTKQHNAGQLAWAQAVWPLHNRRAPWSLTLQGLVLRGLCQK